MGVLHQSMVTSEDSLSNLDNTAQKMKFSIKDIFSKCDQIRRKLRILLHLLKKSLMEKCKDKKPDFQIPIKILKLHASPNSSWQN